MEIIDDELLAKRAVRVFFVNILKNEASLPSETRKYFGTIKAQYKAILVMGGNPLVRAAENTSMRALSILSGNRMPFAMVKTMDEARTVINKLRSAEHPPR